jgi:DNA-3-methyladenine glycosylase II
MVRGTFDPTKLAHLENRQAAERLLQLRGVGRWTAEYVLLRSLGRTDVFPGDDVGARNNLTKWLDLKVALDYNAVNQALAKWRPYAGLLYFHLLLDNLASMPGSEFNSFTTA